MSHLIVMFPFGSNASYAAAIKKYKKIDLENTQEKFKMRVNSTCKIEKNSPPREKMTKRKTAETNNLIVKSVETNPISANWVGNELSCGVEEEEDEGEGALMKGELWSCRDGIPKGCVESFIEYIMVFFFFFVLLSSHNVKQELDEKKWREIWRLRS